MPLPRCDASGGISRCVQCLGDTDCDAPLVCDGTTRSCVECTITDSTACRADLAGSRCLGVGKCGCSQDDDCGGTTSGRICDTGL